MKLRVRQHLIWTLALLLGQFLGLAHAFEHPALAPETHCEVCVHAHVLSAGAVTEACTGLPAQLRFEAPQLTLQRAAAAPLHSLQRIRGPPRISG